MLDIQLMSEIKPPLIQLDSISLRYFFYRPSFLLFHLHVSTKVLLIKSCGGLFSLKNNLRFGLVMAGWAVQSQNCACMYFLELKVAKIMLQIHTVRAPLYPAAFYIYYIFEIHFFVFKESFFRKLCPYVWFVFKSVL